jgi:HAD superfamily hydrolase (TIGR01484 family)
VNAPFLFAADLDGTLLPNTGQRPAAGCLERTLSLLRGLRDADYPVCFVSGRHLSLARDGVGAFRLPPPDWWICNVGTEIYARSGAPDLEWARLAGPELDRPALRRALDRIPGLVPQEAQKQGPRKLSFYYPRPVPVQLRGEILERAEAVQSGLRLVASVEESSGRALLDLVPADAGKASAVAHVAGRYGLPRQQIFFAGDSDNDLDAVLSGVAGTLVGNTPEPVRRRAQHCQSRLPEARLFIAEAFYGDGVIEGLGHYGLWP